jgi:hypothetical protein
MNGTRHYELPSSAPGRVGSPRGRAGQRPGGLPNPPSIGPRRRHCPADITARMAELARR